MEFKKSTRVLSFILAIAMAICCVPTFQIEASANQSAANSGGFSKNYTLTGDGAKDMVSVAKAQLGKTGSNLKYYEEWCDNFVSDCAILAGQSKAVPQGSTAQDFINKLKKCGATRVSTPQAGDIIAIYWGSTCGHVGIMIDKSTCIDGNNGGDGTTKYTRKVAKTAYKYFYGTYEFYRPNYTNSSITYSAAASSGNITNNTADLSVKLNNKVSVEKSDIRFLYSTDSDMKTNVKTEYANRSFDFTGSNAYTCTISKLVPGTKYYYQAIVKVNGKDITSSKGSFKTTAVKPDAPTLQVSSISQTIGIGDQASVLWDGVKGASSYELAVYNPSGKLVKTLKPTGNKHVIDLFTTSGTWTVKLTAVNDAGKTEGNTASIVVKPDCTVTFKDGVDGTILETKKVHYGHAIDAPKAVQHEGHTFSKWDTSLTKITSDITVTSVYDVNSYEVAFVDSSSNKIVKTETVKYGSSATAPKLAARSGYTQTWDKDFSNVKKDMIVYSVWTWNDPDTYLELGVNSAKRDSTGEGYEVNVTLTNHRDEITTGRVVVVLKSKNGVFLGTRYESDPFAIDVNGTKTMTVNVLCNDIAVDNLAYKVQVYVINDFENLGVISRIKEKVCDNSISTTSSSNWSTNQAYKTTTTKLTAQEILDAQAELKAKYGYSEVEINNPTTSTTPTKYYYRYKTKETKTSYSTSLDGYTQNGYSLTDKTTGTIDYVSSWPSGFSTSHSLYTKYHKTPKSAVDNSTTKTTVSTSTIGYLYWHWSYALSGSHSEGNRCIEDTKGKWIDGGGSATEFEAFMNSSALSWNSSAGAYKATGHSSYSWWWLSWSCTNNTQIPVKRCSYTTYKKLYNYYKISDYSDWIEYDGVNCPISKGDSAGTNKTIYGIYSKEVAGSTTYKYTYKYKTSSTTVTTPTVEEPTVGSENLFTISGNVGEEYAGKQVSVWAYEGTKASEDNIVFAAYLSSVGADGSVNISNAKFTKSPTIETGDFTIVASVVGQDKAKVIGTIEAPKPSYTVNFYASGESIESQEPIKTQVVVEGGNASAPSIDSLNLPEGQRFVNWSESFKNVRTDMDIYPETEYETYTVAFVDWNAQTVDLNTFTYGDMLVASKSPVEKEGYVTEWVINISDDPEVDNYVTLDEFIESGKTVTGNMVVETCSTIIENTVTILDSDPDVELSVETGIKDYESSGLVIAEVQSVEYGSRMNFKNVTDIEESDLYVFDGWYNAATDEKVTETVVTNSITIYPKYTFSNTADAPVADIESGEYSENQLVTLTCDTPYSTIWYTTDGSDPTTSSTALIYDSPIAVNNSCEIKYYATALACNDSVVATSVYAINTVGNDKYHVVNISYSEYDENIEAILIKENTNLSLDNFSVIEGYKIVGVYTDQGRTNAFDYENTGITESITLYVKYEAVSNTVTFKNYNGDELKSESVPYGTAATAPTVPERDGYKFTGWDKDFDNVIEDMTVTAQFIPESEYATVTLNRNSRKVIDLKIGYSFNNLVARISPEKYSNYEVVWTSSDESVAKVDEDGVITGVDEGIATITAKLPYTGSSASVTVKVSADPSVAIIIADSSRMGFDSAHNLREVPIGKTVAQLLEQFDNEELVFTDASGATLAEDDIVGTGTTISLYNDFDELMDSTIVVVTGDYNGDGLVDNKDVVMVNQRAVETRESSDIETLAIDVNGDGVVNNIDCITLSRYLVGKAKLG